MARSELEGPGTVMFLNKTPPPLGSILYHTGGGLISENHGTRVVFDEAYQPTHISIGTSGLARGQNSIFNWLLGVGIFNTCKIPE